MKMHRRRNVPLANLLCTFIVSPVGECGILGLAAQIQNDCWLHSGCAASVVREEAEASCCHSELPCLIRQSELL